MELQQATPRELQESPPIKREQRPPMELHQATQRELQERHSHGVAEVRIVDLPPVDNEVTVMENGDQSLALTPDCRRCTSMISFHSFTLIWTVKIFLLGQC